MSRSRMFGGDEPEAAPATSPRTTIVGARPPEKAADLPPVPTGLQRLLRMASVDGAFRQELLSRRAEMAAAAGVVLTASEEAILRAVPVQHLAAMIAGLPSPPPDRRGAFLRAAAAAMAVLGGAAGVAACAGDQEPGPTRPQVRDMESEGGIAPEPPPDRNDHRMPAPGGAAPDLPPLPEPPPPAMGAVDAGAFATPPPPLPPGTAKPEPPPPRPDRPVVTRGIAPDKP